jgi:hypothetical protein
MPSRSMRVCSGRLRWLGPAAVITALRIFMRVEILTYYAVKTKKAAEGLLRTLA